MESLEGKYFEKVIAELNKIKQEEKIVPDQKFRDNLRAGLMQRAVELAEEGEAHGFDWNGFWSKWKYALGAVPTLAVLTVAAMNWADFKVDMKGNEYIPVVQDQIQNTQTGEVDNVDKTAVPDRPAIQTFSAESVLPPADILEKYLNEKKGSEIPAFEESTFVEVMSEPADAPAEAFKTLDSSKNVNSLKIAQPSDKSSDVNKGKGNDNTPVVQTQEDDQRSQYYYVMPATSSVRKTVPVIPKIVNIPEQNRALVPVVPEVDVPSVPVELNGRVEENGQVQTSQDGILKNVEVNEDQLQRVNSMSTFSGGSDAVKANFDSIVPSESNNYLEFSRIRYAGADLEAEAMRINQFIMSEFANLNGNLSSDYYFDVRRLDSGTLKVSLYEFGQVKKLVFVKLIDGQYRTVTEINY